MLTPSRGSQPIRRQRRRIRHLRKVPAHLLELGGGAKVPDEEEGEEAVARRPAVSFFPHLSFSRPPDFGILQTTFINSDGWKEFSLRHL